jgi:2-polyprenyl-6-hydroxyphenyl methylase/3-demethylubiquinone-9 3-methyltransferase
MAIIFHDDFQKELEKYFQYGSYRTRLFHRLRIERIKSFFKKYRVKNAKILDVGCSAGAHSIDIASENEAVVGFDPEVSALKKFGAWVKERKLKNLTIDEGVAEKMPYPNNYFDLVVCSEVLEHVQNIKKSVSEMFRVLKPGGLLFLSMPNKFGFDYVFLARKYYREHGKPCPDPHTHFSPSKIRSLLPTFNLLEEHGNGIIAIPWRFLPRITRHKLISFAYYNLDRLLGKTPLKFFGTNYFLVLQKPLGNQ